MELLEYEFARNALLGMIFLSVLSGIVGTYIVVRRMVFMAGGVTHASFGGVGLAYYLGFPPTLGALAFGVATALGVDALHSKGVRHDSAIAMLWSLGMALGVIFMTMTPGYAPNLMGFMFGDALAMSRTDIEMLGLAAIVTTALTITFYRPLLYMSFDPQYAQLTGWPVRAFNMVTSIIIALSISLTIKAVGIILVLSIFTVPPTMSSMFAKSLGRIMSMAGITALIGSVGGLMLSFKTDLPAGALISAILITVLLIVKIIKGITEKKRA